MYQKNEIVELQITDLGSEGEGIGKIDGFPFFVKGALPGDTIRASVMKAKKNMAFARLQEILVPSPDRIDAPCPVFGRCGGCQLMHLAYPAQLRYKEQKVKNALQRIGGISKEILDAVMEPVIGMTATGAEKEASPAGEALKSLEVPNPRSGCDKEFEEFPMTATGSPKHSLGAETLRYRNKTQVPFGRDREGNTIYGFYAGRTHAVIPCADCLLGSAENKEILQVIREWMDTFHVQPYDETDGKGLIRHVLIRKGFHTGHNEDLPAGKSLKRLKAGAGSPKQSLEAEIMVCLVINGKKLPKKEALCERLAQIPGMHSVSVSINEENTNVIMGDNYETLWGEDVIYDEICRCKYDDTWSRIDGSGITYGISPLSFYQVNPVQTEKLYTTALEYAGLTGQETVWDLYCGIGTISLFLAQRAKQVYGVEIVPQAIDDARENAKRNGITNAQFFVGAAEEVLPAYYRGELPMTAMGSPEQSSGAEKEASPVGEALKSLEAATGSPKQSLGASMRHPDVIVVDPPRKGCDSACLETMVQMQPQRIVYVSCDPATLARDMKYLCVQGYELKRVRACDMFPNSFHVETIELIEQIIKAKDHVQVGIDAEEYYRIKDSEKKTE